MRFMNKPRQHHGTVTDFKKIWADSAFWSCCGYDGLSLVFNLPLEVVRSLPEGKKRALLKLIGCLAQETDQNLRVRVESLRDLTPAERLVALVEYSARFAS